MKFSDEMVEVSINEKIIPIRKQFDLFTPLNDTE